jgi:TrmH family RNA methyltransferase
VDLWNPKVVRASAGSTFHLPVVQSDPSALLQWLRKHAFELWGAQTSGAEAGTLTVPRRVALALGNEGAGLRPELLSQVDHLVSIAMPGRAESLNVAVAAGILMYLVSR